MPDDPIEEQDEETETPEPAGTSVDSQLPAPIAAPSGSPQNVQQPPDFNTVRDQALDRHPQVTGGHLLRKTAEAIAGGPRIKTTIDPNTGTVTRERVPLSSKDILLGAVANILGGAGQVAGNLSNRMAGRAPQQIQPLPTQQAQARQQQQAIEDFNRVQTAKLQKAKVLHANMEAMRTAYAIGKEADESKDEVISNHADDLAQWSKSGAVEASKIPSNELMQKGFDKTKYVAIPDGKVPVLKADGTRAIDANGIPLSQLTYSVVDGTTQTPLTQDKYDQFAKYGLMNTKEGFKLPEGATITGASLALMNHKLDLINQTQREIDEVNGPGKVDIASKIKQNPQLLSAIEKFHNDGHSTEPDEQITNLDKVHPGAAGLMRGLFGNEALQKYKEDRVARVAGEVAGAKKAGELKAEGQGGAGIKDENQATAILADPNSSLERRTAAQNFLKIKADTKFTDKESELKAQRDLENQDLAESARNVVAGNLATVKNVASFRGDQKSRFFNMVTAEAKLQGKDPKDYSPEKLEAKAKVLNDFSDGKAADNIMAYNTFLGHANDAMSATQAMRAITGTPLLNRPINWLRKNAANDTSLQALDASLIPVKKEYMNFLNNNRAEHEGDIKDMQVILSDDSTPAQIESSLKKLGESGDIRLRELGRKYSNTMGEEYPNLLAPESRQALQRMGVQTQNLPKAPTPIEQKQQILNSINLPANLGGGHPADVRKMPDGSYIVHTGKPGDPWYSLKTGQPVQ